MAVLQPSSLAKYATARSPGQDLYNGSTSRDFCNAFWGTGDAGVNIMLTKVKGGVKTMEELIEFWKERTAIEEDYANRLLRLSKTALGGEEIGEIRSSIDTLRLETQVQASLHAQLATQFRKELEVSCQNFLEKQTKHVQEVLTPVERKFRIKQQYESYVNKAREKYETDCLRIASYTQQMEYTSGKDQERLQSKLKRAQQTVQANEKDLINFTNNVADILPDWEREWKEFCDTSQDLEEDRLDYLKDVLWSYANGVSTLCVADDQSCERIRTALDQLETERDLLNFVQEYGTGNSIPDPPVFVPYSGQPTSATHASVPANTGLASASFHIAQYNRVSTRGSQPIRGDEQQPPQPTQVQDLMPYPPNLNPSSPRDSLNGATGAASIRSAQTRSETSHPPGASPIMGPQVTTGNNRPQQPPPPITSSPAPIPVSIGVTSNISASMSPNPYPPPSVSPPPPPQPSMPMPATMPNDPAPSYPPEPYDNNYYHTAGGTGAPAPSAAADTRVNGDVGHSHPPSSYQQQMGGAPQASGSSGPTGNGTGNMNGPTRQLSQRHGQALPVPGSSSASASGSASPSTQSPPVVTPQMVQQQQQALMVDRAPSLHHSHSGHSLYAQQNSMPQPQQHFQQPQQPAPPEDERRRSIEDQYAAGSQAPVLFYVKALYDYTATIDEEFDFQVGDVIAVTATPEDGWWSGMLLDENRRIEGKHVFPSNFVCLF